MNKKNLVGLALAGVITISSTSIVAFASESAGNSTRNVVKVANTKVEDTVANTSSKLMNISDQEAIEKAKKAIKTEFGVDVDAAGFTNVITPLRVTDPTRDAYKLEGPTISVGFWKPDGTQFGTKKSDIFNDARVSISLVDGKVNAVSFVDGINKKAKVEYDENKLKGVAEEFLKEKGLRTDFKAIRNVGRSQYVPIASVAFDYGDGTGERVCINLQNYKAYGFSPLNYKYLDQMQQIKK